VVDLCSKIGMAHICSVGSACRVISVGGGGVTEKGHDETPGCRCEPRPVYLDFKIKKNERKKIKEGSKDT